jgi:hypothetical protein
MTKDEFLKKLPWLSDEQVKEIIPSLRASLTEDEFEECAVESICHGLWQMRNRWIEGSGKSEAEIKEWQREALLKYIEELRDKS